jgi:histidyl-tRNA synthetase
VELDLSGAAFGKQFKRADRSGAPWAAVIGDREAEEGVVLLKDLRRRGDPAEERLGAEELLRRLTLQSP